MLSSLKDLGGGNPFATLDTLCIHIFSSIKKNYQSVVMTVLNIITIPQSQQSPNFEGVDLASFLLLQPGHLRYSLANLAAIHWIHATSPRVFLHASFFWIRDARALRHCNITDLTSRTLKLSITRKNYY